MIITEIIDNKSTPRGQQLLREHHIETLFLDNEELRKKILRKHTDHGTEIGIRFTTNNPPLADGDILACDEHNAIVVALNPSDVLIIRPTTLVSMGFVAHSLGNRHLPAQFFDAASGFDPSGRDCMVVQYDHTVEEFLVHNGIPFSRSDKVTPKPFTHAEHTH